MRSWTDDEWFEKSASMVRQSSSAGHLSTLGRSDMDPRLREARRKLKALEMPYEKKVKRTKSLWKFRSREDDGGFEGMAMWRHRSLIDISQAEGAEGGARARRRRAPGSSSEDSPDTDSCIVVNDHLKKAEESSTILPRTRLIRKKETTTTVELHQSRIGPAQPWYNSWDQINA